jgi:hypothetical protein
LRIQKFKQKKGKFDFGLKICELCSLEYNEKENFKWSCRSHQSNYSGTIWWCCGKKDKKATGCRIGKHHEKADEEEDEEGV